MNMKYIIWSHYLKRCTFHSWFVPHEIDIFPFTRQIKCRNQIQRIYAPPPNPATFMFVFKYMFVKLGIFHANQISILIHIKNWGEVGTVNMFKSSRSFLTDRSKAVLLFWIILLSY